MDLRNLMIILFCVLIVHSVDAHEGHENPTASREWRDADQNLLISGNYLLQKDGYILIESADGFVKEIPIEILSWDDIYYVHQYEKNTHVIHDHQDAITSRYDNEGFKILLAIILIFGLITACFIWIKTRRSQTVSTALRLDPIQNVGREQHDLRL